MTFNISCAGLAMPHGIASYENFAALFRLW